MDNREKAGCLESCALLERVIFRQWTLTFQVPNLKKISVLYAYIKHTGVAFVHRPASVNFVK